MRVPQLRALRHRVFLTQGELAEKSGVSEPSIRRLEAGTSGASFKTIRKLATALGVEPGELVGRAGEGEAERASA